MAKKTTRKATKTATKARGTARKTTKAATKRSGRRELLDTGRDARYAKRTRSGEFAEMDDVGRSQRTDKSKKARTAVPSGFGDQGDRRAAKKPPAKKRPAKKR
jgi:hypothetical protein